MKEYYHLSCFYTYYTSINGLNSIKTNFLQGKFLIKNEKKFRTFYLSEPNFICSKIGWNSLTKKHKIKFTKLLCNGIPSQYGVLNDITSYYSSENESSEKTSQLSNSNFDDLSQLSSTESLPIISSKPLVMKKKI